MHAPLYRWVLHSIDGLPVPSPQIHKAQMTRRSNVILQSNWNLLTYWFELGVPKVSGTGVLVKIRESRELVKTVPRNSRQWLWKFDLLLSFCIHVHRTVGSTKPTRVYVILWEVPLVVLKIKGLSFWLLALCIFQDCYFRYRGQVVSF